MFEFEQKRFLMNTHFRRRGTGTGTTDSTGRNWTPDLASRDIQSGPRSGGNTSGSSGSLNYSLSRRALSRVLRRGSAAVIRRGNPILNTLDLFQIVKQQFEEHTTSRGGDDGGISPGSGWSIYAECGSPRPDLFGPITIFGQSLAEDALDTSIENCLSNQSPTGIDWADVSNFAKSVIFSREHISPFDDRHQLLVGISRPGTGDPGPDPVTQPQLASQVVLADQLPDATKRAIAIWPDLAPIAQVTPMDMPAVPYTTPSQLRKVHPFEQRINDLSPEIPQYAVPNDWSMELTSSKLVPPSPPKYHLKLPPEPGTREQKTGMTRAQYLVVRAINETTEVFDILDALYDALPDHAKARWKNTEYEKMAPTPYDQLRQLYEHTHEIDVHKAYINLVKNQIEDKAYGKLGQISGQFSRDFGISYGAGLTSTLNRINKMRWETKSWQSENDQAHYEGP